jgi:SAM-dependent methyltransferase
MSEISLLFGANAHQYASFRPHYPEPLFAWLAQRSPANNCALDIGCGNGQASHPLRAYFTLVLACDRSFAQVSASPAQPGVQLLVADARQLPIASASLDLIVAAQALHWFADAAFFAQAQLLLKPKGLLCAWCYGLLSINPSLDRLIQQLYYQTLGDYWPAARSSVDCGYQDIAAPFPRLAVESFAMQQSWTFTHLLGYLRTWSALELYNRQNSTDPLLALLPAMQRAWGSPQQSHIAKWPLHFLAGYPNN